MKTIGVLGGLGPQATMDFEVRKRLGIIGVGDPFIYTRPLDALSIAHHVLEPERREPIDAAVFRVMEGREDESDRRRVHDAVLLNPAQLLAKAAVQLALD